VQEDKLLQELRRVQGRISIPDDKASVLIQPAGQEWRRFHQVTLQWIGAIAILGMLLVLVIFYLWRGMVRIQAGRSGRTVVRFNGFERFIHWMTAACFVVLGISGLNITFGKSLLLPLMSPEAFTAWSQWLKYAHNYLSFPFTLGVIVIFLMWIGGNIPNRTDARWLREGGGLLNPNKHPPAYRFNAGQKVIYWIVVIGGAAVAISGYILMFPFYGDISVGGMQTAQVVHGIVAVLFVAVMLAHIYIGSIGMEGAFEAMGSGEVDVNWAKEHHRLWVEEEMSGTAGAKARMTPAE
jgi:formate dehydrogenase subunit gamma